MTDMFAINFLRARVNPHGYATGTRGPKPVWQLADTDTGMCHKELFVSRLNVTFKGPCENASYQKVHLRRGGKKNHPHERGYAR